MRSLVQNQLFALKKLNNKLSNVSNHTSAAAPDRKVDIKDNQLGIKLIPTISTWDQLDPIFPVRQCRKREREIKRP
jgi:hypothetical protein